MLGWFRAPSEVGIFRIVSMGASLTVMPIAAFGLTIAGAIARMNAAGDFARLQAVISRSTQVITIIAAFGWALPFLATSFFSFHRETPAAESHCTARLLGM